MNKISWERRAKSEMVYALIYVGAFCFGISVAVWNFFEGFRVGAAIVGATALPFPFFAAMRLNNRRLIRTLLQKQGDTHA